MTQEPLRSVISLAEVGETSLALPSDGESRSGQRRVLEQVNTMRRTKSKYNSRGSAGTLSPTSPKSDTVFYETKLPSSNVNGLDFMCESSLANGHTKTRKHNYSVMQRSTSTRSGNYHRIPVDNMLPNSLPALNQSSAQADYYASQAGIRGNTTHWSQKHRQTKKLMRSYSQPPPYNSVQITGNGNVQSTSSQYFGSNTINLRPSSDISYSEPKVSVASRTKGEMNGMNGELNMTDMTVLEAISWISQEDERLQLQGASFIQHSTYKDDKAKEEVRKQNGITQLVSLLSSPNPQIQIAAVSALRNLVFKNSANKEEVLRTGGLSKALQLLQETESTEIQKHITGLLWNLSSEERIQSDLLRKGLPVLTAKALQPNTVTSSSEPDFESRAEIFCNATACLRNLSSGKLTNRQTMRNCEGLIDSLVGHARASVENGLMDEKSVENCVCVLHNLTFQLESEMPSLFNKMQTLSPSSESRANTVDISPVGCFSNQSRKLQQERSEYPLMDDFSAKGKSLLTHSETLQMYLNLLNSSQNTTTQEACCGALHNLTAKRGILSDVMSYTIVQRLNGLPNITPHLESSHLALRNNITTLIGNLSRTPQLQRTMVRKALPDVLKTLTPDITPESDSTVAVACHMANNLLRAEPELGKDSLSSRLINTLTNISENRALPRASKAAGVLLQSLWSDKTIQSSLKKKLAANQKLPENTLLKVIELCSVRLLDSYQGMSKRFFVNETTSAALKAMQIVE